VAGGKFQGLARRARGVHVVLADPQVDPQRADYLRLVVNHQNARHGTTLSCSPIAIAQRRR
jgi:hypothetical protein